MDALRPEPTARARTVANSDSSVRPAVTVGASSPANFAREGDLLDQTLFAIDNEEIPIVVQITESAGVERPLAAGVAAQHFLGLRRSLPVALHELWRAEHDLARCAVRHRRDPVLRVYDAD